MQGRIAIIRQLMKDQHYDAYLVSNSDPHQSEYSAEHFHSRSWLSGFDGSVGTLIVSREQAGLWVDSRYFIEAEQALKDSSITVFKQGLPNVLSPAQWLAENLSAEQTVSFDARTSSVKAIRDLEQSLKRRDIKIVPGLDLVAKAWTDQPALPTNPIRPFETNFALVSRKEKLANLVKYLAEENLQCYLLSALDDIAWLLNLRGSDVPYNPVFLAWLLVGIHGSTLFVDLSKISAETYKALNDDGIDVAEYDSVGAFLQTLPPDDRILLPPESTSIFCLQNTLHMNQVLESSPIANTKATKTEMELDALRSCLVRDGIALVQAFAALEHSFEQGSLLSEYSVSQSILQERKKQEYFVSESFAPIVAYGANAAIVHYRTPIEGSETLKTNGVLLIDTGAHYSDGTSDITRVLALGTPSPAMINAYTLVLKGHIALAGARFPQGTSGVQLDILARKYLWDQGLDYGHGTSHGIGFCLNVHEGPVSISPSATALPLRAGMVFSNEPGFYQVGQFGVRIENMIVVKEDNKAPGFLCFETISLCPLEPKLIDKSLLDAADLAWIKAYHKTVMSGLGKHLERDALKWLKEKIRLL